MTPLTTIAEGGDSGISTARRTVVRDGTAWTALWAAHAGPASMAPPIDFTSRLVAAVFAGERPSPGHSIRIAAARADADTLTLTVREQPPAAGTMAPQVLVSPFHIVSLPRFNGTVRFADDGAGEASTASAIKPGATGRPGRARRMDGSQVSSTGLDENFASALAYLAGPFSGILILIVERSSRAVRFHAWQSVLVLGGIGLLAASALLASFLTLLVSPLAFTAMYRLSEIAALLWVVAWVWCLVNAFSGRRWRMPVAGRYAERLAARPLRPAG
jgi:uncharacterized membrane protein